MTISRQTGSVRRVDVRQTDEFSDWVNALRDEGAKARIDQCLSRIAMGNFGDAEPVGEGVSELRIHYGPGYRLYAARRGREVVILLCGGDKSTQGRDIRRGRALAKEV